MKGLSENIRVTSIVGQFLEHSRIYYFENTGGHQPELYLGSADWMPRNFFRRIEVVFPVLDPQLRRRILKDILPAYQRDNAYATELHANGAYFPVPAKSGEPPFSAQEYFLAQAAEAAAAEAKAAEKAREKPALRPEP
jgi:polyphosphate kinase